MKLWIYLVLLTGLMLFLTMAGITGIGSNELMGVIGYSEGQNHTISNVTISSSTIMTYLFGNDLNFGSGVSGLLVALIGASAISIGAALYSKDINWLLAPFILFVAVKWIQVCLGIINYGILHGDILVSTIIGLMFIPLTLGFVVSLIEFIRGTD